MSKKQVFPCQWDYWVRINVKWFGKFDPFLIFHDAVIPTWPENHDTKTWYKKGKNNFSLINAGWIVTRILHIFFNVNQINQLHLSNNIYVNDTHREELCFTQSNTRINSQSLSLPHMGNVIHFFLLTDIAYLVDYEFQGIGWFLIGGPILASHRANFFFLNYPIPYIPFDW